MFASRDRSIDESALHRVFTLFDGNTFYLQRTMNGAFAETPQGERCTEETVTQTIKGMLASNEVMYREMLSNVSKSRKATLYAIAREHLVTNPTSGEFILKYSLTSSSSVQNALLKLIKSGLLSRTSEGYFLTDPLLRIFINNLYSIPEI